MQIATPASDPGCLSIDDPAPNPLSRGNATALIDVLAALEGELLAGLDSGLWNRLAQRLRAQGGPYRPDR